MDEPIRTVVSRLRSAESVLWITGAGLSADSGLPTYRGIGGLYEDNDTIDGMPIELALSGDVFKQHPELTWKYIHQIEQAVRHALPNDAHRILAASESRFSRALTLTQNVDGFHRAAGSKSLIDIHGDLYDLYCTGCAWRERVSSYVDLDPVPACANCGSSIRPDVVFFGELLPMMKVARLEQELTTGFDAVFSIGTTAVFPYISQPLVDARRQGKLTVEINPGETDVSRIAEFRIREGAAHALDQIWRGLRES
ncbi:MAG: NAD-dependent protein deacylase [Pseudomonadota bacterium]